jgi:hypothetical protein
MPREGSVSIPRSHEIFFFGCHDEGPGHFWWRPGFTARHLYPDDERRLLFKNIDSGFAPTPEVDGHAKITHIEGWTVLAWWDRSIDKRGKSNSALVAKGHYHFASMIHFLGVYFPTVARRQLQEIKCVEEPEPCTEAT